MQFYQVSQTSLAKSGSSIVEEYIPLWMSDGTYASINTNTSGSFLEDGSTSTTNLIANSNIKLHTLNSNWSSSQKFALEVTLSTSTSSSYTAYCELYDFTAGAFVSASQISTTSTTMTVVRSSQFTLIPSHSYGISFWSSNSSYPCQISDASLIAFT